MNGMLDFKTSCWSGTDPFAGTVFTNEVKCRFQHLVTATQRIVFGIGDRRVIFLIVAGVVGSDFDRQQLQFRGHFGRSISRYRSSLCHFCNQAVGCRRASSVILAPASMRAISSRRSS